MYVSHWLPLISDCSHCHPLHVEWITKSSSAALILPCWSTGTLRKQKGAKKKREHNMTCSGGLRPTADARGSVHRLGVPWEFFQWCGFCGALDFESTFNSMTQFETVLFIPHNTFGWVRKLMILGKKFLGTLGDALTIF